jgi:hypothetical protein
MTDDQREERPAGEMCKHAVWAYNPHDQDERTCVDCEFVERNESQARKWQRELDDAGRHEAAAHLDPPYKQPPPAEERGKTRFIPDDAAERIADLQRELDKKDPVLEMNISGARAGLVDYDDHPSQPPAAPAQGEDAVCPTCQMPCFVLDGRSRCCDAVAQHPCVGWTGKAQGEPAVDLDAWIERLTGRQIPAWLDGEIHRLIEYARGLEHLIRTNHEYEKLDTLKRAMEERDEFKRQVRTLEERTPVWAEPPDCPRCGKRLSVETGRHGDWRCEDHDITKGVWFNYELTGILNARIRTLEKSFDAMERRAIDSERERDEARAERDNVSRAYEGACEHATAKDAEIKRDEAKQEILRIQEANKQVRRHLAAMERRAIDLERELNEARRVRR